MNLSQRFKNASDVGFLPLFKWQLQLKFFFDLFKCIRSQCLLFSMEYLLCGIILCRSFLEQNRILLKYFKKICLIVILPSWGWKFTSTSDKFELSACLKFRFSYLFKLLNVKWIFSPMNMNMFYNWLLKNNTQIFVTQKKELFCI